MEYWEFFLLFLVICIIIFVGMGGLAYRSYGQIQAKRHPERIIDPVRQRRRAWTVYIILFVLAVIGDWALFAYMQAPLKDM